MKLGCMDFNFNYLPFPAAAAGIGTYYFMGLAKLGIARRYRYASRALRLISRMGFSGAQVMCQDANQMPMKPAGLQDLCDELNLGITSIGGYADFFDSGKMETFRGVIDFAAESGTKIVCTHSGKGRSVSVMVNNLAEAVDYASSRGVTVALENSPLHSIASTDGIEMLVNEIPKLRANFDAANFLLAGVNPVNAAEKLKKYVVHAHAKDVKASTFVSVGSGIVPWADIIRELKGYNGFLVLEHEGSGNPLEETAESKRYLDRLINAV